MRIIFNGSRSVATAAAYRHSEEGRLFQLLLSLAVTAAAAGAQVTPHRISVAKIRWADIVDSRGQHRTAPMLEMVDTPPLQNTRLTFAPGLAAVATLDDQFRIAILANDTQALARILSDDYFVTNQNGDSRNKAEFIASSRSFPITSLRTTAATVRSAGNVVIVAGTQTEVNMRGTDRMLFTRVYRLEGSNEWKLLSSTQFRVP
jgi:Domain of unknown function (DUF4440)